MKHRCFAANLLLPPATEAPLFSVVACDQYTAQPVYWQAVSDLVGSATSSYHMTYPEVYLGTEDPAVRITAINNAMRNALDSDFFEEIPNGMVLVKRRLRNGTTRTGLVCCIDLEDYDFHAGSTALIRATEGTVLSRIPPRVQVRTDAPIEFPHVMLLIDDPKQTVLEPLDSATLPCCYDFDLMQDSGHLQGFLLDEGAQQQVHQALESLVSADPSPHPLLFAVGDGNHSLATAKTCYEAIKQTMGEQAYDHPARYALVEIVNLHDPSLTFEAIHRIVLDTNVDHLLGSFTAWLNAVPEAIEGGQQVTVVQDGKQTIYTIQSPKSHLAVGSVQAFLDYYLQTQSGEVDYIHGEEVVVSLSKQQHTVGFLFPAMQKNELFETVHTDGVLPRKTFSMGEAEDKRFYLEGRRLTR